MYSYGITKTFLITAAITNKFDVCYLYKVYFKPFYQHIKAEVTPLHFAAIYGEFEISKK